MKRALALIGLGLFVYILSTLNLCAAADSVRRASVGLVLLGLVLILASFALKALRHHGILRAQGISVPLKTASDYYFQSVFWGFLSPGRVGEFSRVAYLRDYAGSRVQSAANVVIDRIFDLASVGLFVLIAASLADIPYKSRVVGGLCAILALGLLIVVVLQKVLKPGSGDSLLRNLLLEILRLRGKTGFLLASLGIWLINYAGMYCLAASLDLKGGFWFIVLCTGASNLIAIVPITIAGIGTRDALLVYLFRSASLPAELAVAYSAFFILSYAVQIGFSYIFVLKSGMGRKKRQAPQNRRDG